MRDSLPAIIYEDFTEEVLAEILKIYSRVAKIKNPCDTTFNLEHDFPIIYAAMCDRQVCEFRFGSIITRHSKLIFYPVFKRDGQHVPLILIQTRLMIHRKSPLQCVKNFTKKQGNISTLFLSQSTNLAPIAPRAIGAFAFPPLFT